MGYPERPICHGEKSPILSRKVEWELRKAEGTYGANLRHCNYCGSLHPEDLLKVLNEGARLQGADWKYGWPHKFYVEGIKNPRAGETVRVGGHMYTDAEGVQHDDPIMGTASATVSLKFYNEHLLDLAGTPEFGLVAEAIRKQTGIKFEIREDKLYYATCQWDKSKSQ